MRRPVRVNRGTTTGVSSNWQPSLGRVTVNGGHDFGFHESEGGKRQLANLVVREIGSVLPDDLLATLTVGLTDPVTADLAVAGTILRRLPQRPDSARIERVQPVVSI